MTGTIYQVKELAPGEWAHEDPEEGVYGLDRPGGRMLIIVEQYEDEDDLTVRTLYEDLTVIDKPHVRRLAKKSERIVEFPSYKVALLWLAELMK